jgi:hypothetical protein
MPPECSLAPTYDPFSIEGFYIGFAEAVNLLALWPPQDAAVSIAIQYDISSSAHWSGMRVATGLRPTG